jgi:hypothetical protein
MLVSAGRHESCWSLALNDNVHSFMLEKRCEVFCFSCHWTICVCQLREYLQFESNSASICFTYVMVDSFHALVHQDLKNALGPCQGDSRCVRECRGQARPVFECM